MGKIEDVVVLVIDVGETWLMDGRPVTVRVTCFSKKHTYPYTSESTVSSRLDDLFCDAL